MKYMLTIALLLFTGCSSMNYAGTADYSIKPFVDSAGVLHCCEVEVHNGKEIGHLVADIKAKADGSYTVHLEETSVKAFKGQEIASGVAGKVVDVIPALIP